MWNNPQLVDPPQFAHAPLDNSLARQTGPPVNGIAPYVVGGALFEVPIRYSPGKLLGQGAFGVVCSARDNSNGCMVAIKKVSDVFASMEECKRIYREIVLMRNFQHENVLFSQDMFPPVGATRASLEDVYYVTEQMDTNLKRVIESNQPLPPKVVQYISYQLFCALKYLHSANILHRDLKPENVLINSDCEIRVADFGLSRVRSDNSPFMTGYVATRWYRAPEVILTWSSYSLAIDIWAAGCIMAELVARKPLFPGTSYTNQVGVITDIIGSPSSQLVQHIPNPQAREFALNLGNKMKRPLQTLFPGAPPVLIDLFDRVLVLDPTLRLNVDQCLQHPYFADIRDEDVEEVADASFNFDFEKYNPTPELYRELIWQEICYFHPELT